MAKSLVIVESPAKAKTIEKYLGKDFKVKASVGHIKDLPKSKLGVDVKKGFEPTYEVITAKKKVIDELRKAASTADQVFLALDPDREGEAIAWHVAEEIYKGEKEKAGEKGKTKAVKKPLHRVLFNEITKKAVLEAIAHPIDLNKNLYEAQQARRILDRLVGYQVSPLLWDKVRRGLSAGRVQTVALRLICERDRSIKAFNPEEYWTVEALLEGSLPPAFTGKLVSLDGKKFKIVNGDESAKIVGELKNLPHVPEDDHQEGEKTESLSSLHHQPPPAGRLPEAGFLGRADDDAGAAALRRRRRGRGRSGRAHHLYENGLDPHLGRGVERGPGLHRHQAGQGLSPGEAPRL
jgi:DNA topoisomerase-1